MKSSTANLFEGVVVSVGRSIDSRLTAMYSGNSLSLQGCWMREILKRVSTP